MLRFEGRAVQRTLGSDSAWTQVKRVCTLDVPSQTLVFWHDAEYRAFVLMRTARHLRVCRLHYTEVELVKELELPPRFQILDAETRSYSFPFPIFTHGSAVIGLYQPDLSRGARLVRDLGPPIFLDVALVLSDEFHFFQAPHVNRSELFAFDDDRTLFGRCRQIRTVSPFFQLEIWKRRCPGEDVVENEDHQIENGYRLLRSFPLTEPRGHIAPSYLWFGSIATFGGHCWTIDHSRSTMRCFPALPTGEPSTFSVRDDWHPVHFRAVLRNDTPLLGVKNTEISPRLLGRLCNVFWDSQTGERLFALNSQGGYEEIGPEFLRRHPQCAILTRVPYYDFSQPETEFGWFVYSYVGKPKDAPVFSAPSLTSRCVRAIATDLKSSLPTDLCDAIAQELLLRDQ